MRVHVYASKTSAVILAFAAFALSVPQSAVLAETSQTASAQSTSTASAQKQPLLTGKAALGDWSTDRPGVRRKITVNDLPAPFATESVDNGPKIVARPEGAALHVPPGFSVDVFAQDLKNPRQMAVAPNGDVFVAESQANRVSVLRDTDKDGKAETREFFADGLKKPFGIAFYPPGDKPQYVYIANTDSVVRFPYKDGQLKSDAQPETIVDDISGGGHLRGGGHWTRDILFSPDGKTMYVSVGSKNNISDDPVESRRARIFAYSPDGKTERVFASGIRNPVSLATNPVSGELWTSVNERDGLGDFLVPDYITSVKDGGFYGWPWYYIGSHVEPRLKNTHPELKDKIIVPDVLLQAHMASLGMTFYTGEQFPSEFKNDAFAAEHGSWNREHRTGYKVIQVPMENGKATGEYVDFMTGFVIDNKHVWGRPVAVREAKDGSLLVSDDGGNVIWRVSYKK